MVSAEVRQSSFYFHSLINSLALPLSFPARLRPKFHLFINLIFVSRISFPTFCPRLICVSLPAHLLPDTCPASLPLMWSVLWWSAPSSALIDVALIRHNPSTSKTAATREAGTLLFPSEIESFICRRHLFSSRLIPNHDYWALSAPSPDRGDKRSFLEAV